LSAGEILKFDWENKWLKGEEYFYILANMEKYVQAFGLEIFSMKSHPECIYAEPLSKSFSNLKILSFDLLERLCL